MYIRSQLIAQLFVHGESLKSCVIAVVVPDVEVLKAWATKNNVPGTLSVLCQNAQVKKLIMDDMNKLAKEANLKSFEQVWRGDEREGSGGSVDMSREIC